jgi:hypothetical protein
LVRGPPAAPRGGIMAIDLWTTHSLDKLFPDSQQPPRASTAIALHAARNETEDAQVALRIPTGVEIAEATFSLPDLVGPRKRTIPSDRLSARAEIGRLLSHLAPDA